jgi:hypothetical protein
MLYRAVLSCFIAWAQVCGWCAVVIAWLTLLGHLSGHSELAQWIPGQVGMAPNTAVALFFCGFGLFLMGEGVKRKVKANGERKRG